MEVEFEQYFDSAILTRGKDYYISGYVNNVEKQDNVYTASIYGTKVYETSVNIVNGTYVTDFCTCPYGLHCKHAVALLYQLRHTDESQLMKKAEEKEENSLTNIQLLQKISQNELIEFIDKYMQRNIDFKISVQSTFSKYLPQDKEMYINNVDNIIYRNKDRHGYISYYHASDFSTEMSHFIYDLRDLGSEYEYMVFDICAYIMKLMPDLAIDDSGGEVYSIVESCAEVLQDYYDENDTAFTDTVKKWIMNEINSGELENYGLDTPLLELLEEWKPNEEKLVEMRENLMLYKQDSSMHRHYRMNNEIQRLLNVMEDLNFDTKSIAEELLPYIDEEAAIHWFIEQAEERKDMVEYERLLHIGKDNEEKTFKYSDVYTKKLISLFESQQRVDDLRKELRYCFDKGFGNITLFKMYKDITTQETWSKECTILLDALTKNNQSKLEYYKEEAMKTELFKDLQEKSYGDMKDYQDYLGEEYRERLLTFYTGACYHHAQFANNHSYESVYTILIYIQELDKSGSIVKHMLTEFKQLYGRRSNLWKLLNTLKEGEV